MVAWLSHAGYWALFLGMVAESAGTPLPSEPLLAFGGYLVAVGRLDLIAALAAALAGGMVGGVLLYAVGLYGGRPLLVRYGRYVLIRERHIDEADRWFARYGSWSVLVGRMLPVVRTYISLPAGVGRMPFGQFLLYSLVGSAPWTLALLLAGRALGDNWQSLGATFHHVEVALGLVVVVGVALLIWRWAGTRRRAA